MGLHLAANGVMIPTTEKNIQKMAREQDKIIAIGETGLDYHYMNSSSEDQQLAFRKQLRIAVEVNLPVVLHSREAETDTINILKEITVPSLGVAHSFTSSLKMARTLLDMGWYLGINGIVTFKNAENLREVVRWIPLDRLLLETDSPFLTPVPFRGKPNRPAYIPVIASFIAELRQIPIEHLAENTSENANRLFRI